MSSPKDEPTLQDAFAKWNKDLKRHAPIPPALSPALTPKEWRELRFERYVPGVMDCRRPNAHVNAVGVITPFSPEPYKAENGSRHALAALCLHGQSFGFRQADVERLNLVCDKLGTALLEHAPLTYELRRLASRIAALLPETP